MVDMGNDREIPFVGEVGHVLSILSKCLRGIYHSRLYISRTHSTGYIRLSELKRKKIL